MKTYYVDCLVKFQITIPNEDPFMDEELFSYIINSPSKKEAKKDAIESAKLEFDDDAGDIVDIIEITIDDIYETTEDARL